MPSFSIVELRNSWTGERSITLKDLMASTGVFGVRSMKRALFAQKIICGQRPTTRRVSEKSWLKTPTIGIRIYQF